jgi:hypothetical protein
MAVTAFLTRPWPLALLLLPSLLLLVQTGLARADGKVGAPPPTWRGSAGAGARGRCGGGAGPGGCALGGERKEPTWGLALKPRGPGPWR